MWNASKDTCNENPRRLPHENALGYPARPHVAAANPWVRGLDVTAQNAPMCLRERRQWVAWKYVERDGKPTKCPVNAGTGALADSTDRSTWGTFEQAIAACWQDAGLAGVGFVFPQFLRPAPVVCRELPAVQ